MAESESLTADEFRNRLYHKLRHDGYIDSLKSQLRNKLVTELQHSAHGQKFKKEPPGGSDGASLLYRAANSLVADHLRRSHLDYSLSVFLPESGTAQDKVFTVRDLLQLLHISPQSKLYKRVAKDITGYNRKGFLWQLLCELAASHGYSTNDSSVQTDAVPLRAITSLEEKLSSVEEAYSSQKERFSQSGALATEERILAYQRELEERSRAQIKLEVERFKEVELVKMRMEEREKSRKEIQNARQEMDRTYQMKSDALVNRERNAIERLQKQQEMIERETYSQRQSILTEIETMRQRESELRREKEIAERERTLQTEKVKSQEEQLHRRELTLKRTEEETEKKIQNEMTRFRLDEQERLMERSRTLEFQETRLKEEKLRLDEEREGLKTVKSDLHEKTVRVKELEAQLQQSRHELLAATKNTEHFSEKLRDMVDYNTVKEDNAVLRKELDGAKLRLAEVSSENSRSKQRVEDLLREMADKVAQPTPELLLVQAEMEKVRDQTRQDQALAEHSKKQQQQQLHKQVSRNKELKQRLDEQSLQQKEMLREIDDLRQQLQNTQQALNNEIYRKPKPPIVNRFGDTEEVPVHDDTYYDTSLRKTTLDPELLLGDEGGYTADAPSFRFSRSSRRSELEFGEVENSEGSDIVAETRHRLNNLEREAEDLEQNYRNFQERMTNVHSLPEMAPSYMASSSRYSNPYCSPPRHVNFSSPPSEEQPRPLSSTPYRQREHNSRPSNDPQRYPSKSILASSDSRLPRLEASSIPARSPGQSELSPEAAAANQSRAVLLKVDDLDAGPGSPDTLVIPGSDTGSSYQSPPISPEKQEWRDMGSGLPAKDNSIKTQPLETRGRVAADSRPALEAVSKPQYDRPPPATMATDQQKVNLHSGWKAQGSQQTASLDSAWKSQAEPVDDVAERRRREEEERERREKEEREEREWEEKRRQREVERKRREEEEWDRQQKELEQLEKGKSVEAGGKGTGVSKEKEGKEEPEEKPDAGIDPVMQKYMDMIQQQKERETKEKEKLSKTVVGTWSKGKVGEEKSLSISEDISAVDDKSLEGDGLDDDFEW